MWAKLLWVAENEQARRSNWSSAHCFRRKANSCWVIVIHAHCKITELKMRAEELKRFSSEWWREAEDSTRAKWLFITEISFVFNFYNFHDPGYFAANGKGSCDSLQCLAGFHSSQPDCITRYKGKRSKIFQCRLACSRKMVSFCYNPCQLLLEKLWLGFKFQIRLWKASRLNCQCFTTQRYHTWIATANQSLFKDRSHFPPVTFLWSF